KKTAAKAKPAPAPADPPARDEVVPQDDHSLLLSGKPAKTGQHRYHLTPAPGWLAAIRLEALPHSAHGGMITRDGTTSTLVQLSAVVRRAETDKETALAFAQADADHKDPRYSSTAEIIGIRSGWKTSSRHAHEPQTSVWWLDRPVRLAAG